MTTTPLLLPPPLRQRDLSGTQPSPFLDFRPLIVYDRLHVRRASFLVRSAFSPTDNCAPFPLSKLSQFFFGHIKIGLIFPCRPLISVSLTIISWRSFEHFHRRTAVAKVFFLIRRAFSPDSALGAEAVPFGLLLTTGGADQIAGFLFWFWMSGSGHPPHDTANCVFEDHLSSHDGRLSSRFAFPPSFSL